MLGLPQSWLKHPVHLGLGLIIWFIFWFVLIYGGKGVVCEVAPPLQNSGVFNWLTGLLLVLTLVATALMAVWTWLYWRSYQATKADADESARFITTVSLGVYAASTLSTLAVGLPAIVIPPCV